MPVTEAAAVATNRTPTGLDGVDRVLGGGLVPGSLVLVAGEPGVGKSTLLLQVAAATAAARADRSSMSPARSRPNRSPCAPAASAVSSPSSCCCPRPPAMRSWPSSRTARRSLVVVDSIQTQTSEDLDAVAGSVSQVRQVAARFQHLAKTRAIPVVLVGHVTKEGHIAGPKLLEHLVDVVLSLEGEPGHDLRVLRAGKNRFGTVAELALWSMTERGLEARAEPVGVAAGGPPPGGPGIGRRRRARRHRAPAGRGSGAGDSLAPWARPGGWPRASTARAWPCSSP